MQNVCVWGGGSRNHCIIEGVNVHLVLRWKGVNDVMQGESMCHQLHLSEGGETGQYILLSLLMYKYNTIPQLGRILFYLSLH